MALTPVAQKILIFIKRPIIVPKRKINFFNKSVPLEDPFIIVRATPNDTCEILDLMWESYYPDEPTTASLGLGRQRNCVFDDLAMKIICKGNSLLARCKYSGCISGASLNDITCPWDPDTLEKLACTLECKKMSQLFMFNAYLQRVPNLWNKYCTQQVFEIQNVFVRPDDRRKGLAIRLIDASRELGSDAGYKVIRVDATNYATHVICEKLKFKLAHEIPYNAYVGEDMKPIFNPPKPHLSCRTYIDLPHAVKD